MKKQLFALLTATVLIFASVGVVYAEDTIITNKNDIDCNKDGNVDANDALIILKYVANMITEI